MQVKKFIHPDILAAVVAGGALAVILLVGWRALSSAFIEPEYLGDNCILIDISGSDNASVILETMSNIEGEESNTPGNYKSSDPLPEYQRTLRELRGKESPSNDGKE